tara:strand:+ start:33747 stop:34997 length:1251 start_codon:yes stop_codon:yes gene_type:complete
MFRFLIYILTSCLLIISCTHSQKKESVVAIESTDSSGPKDDWFPPAELALFDSVPTADRNISAEANSLEKDFAKVKTPDELEVLIANIEKNYKAVAEVERVLAAELLLLKPFRAYNTMLNQNSIGMLGTDFLTLATGMDTSAWKKNSVINSYLNDSVEKSKRKTISPNDVQYHLEKEFISRVNLASQIVYDLKQGTYKTECTFSCSSNKTVTPLVALKNLSLISAKLGYQAAYKYSDLFGIRKTADSKTVIEGSSKAGPNIVTFNNSDFEIRSAMKDYFSLLSIGRESKKWLKYSYEWYKMYIAVSIRLDSTQTKLSNAFLGNHQIAFKGKVVLVNLAALFDNPNPDLKNFMPTKFDDKKRPLEWDVDSYKAIFPNLRSNEEVAFHVSALADYFPGGLPFPLNIALNTATMIKAKK